MLNKKIKQIVLCAVFIAIATVLSNLKIYKMPTGGSVTAFSMLFVILPGFLFGLPLGLLTGFCYGLIQFVIDPYILNPLQFVNDYVLAFTALGLSGIFYKKAKYLSLAYIVGVVGRFVFATLSGYLFFGEYAWEGWGALEYSLAYNASYIVPELIATLIILQVPAVKKVIEKIQVNLD